MNRAGAPSCRGNFLVIVPLCCGLLADGTAYCWGRNDFGQLGDGSSSAFSSAPVAVGGALKFPSATVGSHHARGISVAGDAYCWGRNSEGALGPDVERIRYLFGIGDRVEWFRGLESHYGVLICEPFAHGALHRTLPSWSRKTSDPGARTSSASSVELISANRPLERQSPRPVQPC